MGLGVFRDLALVYLVYGGITSACLKETANVCLSVYTSGGHL